MNSNQSGETKVVKEVEWYVDGGPSVMDLMFALFMCEKPRKFVTFNLGEFGRIIRRSAFVEINSLTRVGKDGDEWIFEGMARIPSAYEPVKGKFNTRTRKGTLTTFV